MLSVVCGTRTQADSSVSQRVRRTKQFSLCSVWVSLFYPGLGWAEKRTGLPETVLQETRCYIRQPSSPNYSLTWTTPWPQASYPNWPWFGFTNAILISKLLKTFLLFFFPQLPGLMMMVIYNTPLPTKYISTLFLLKKKLWSFPGGPVVKDLLANARDIWSLVWSRYLP